MVKFRPIKIFLFLLFTANYGLAVNNGKLFAQDKIVAIVNNDIITQKDLNDFITFMRMQLTASYKGEQLEKRVQSMKSDLLDKLVEDRLILQEAKKNNIKIDQNRIKQKIDEIKKRYGSDSEFQNALSQQGMVQADLESKITEQLLMYSIIDVKVKSKIVINPGEVTDFYQQNNKKFQLPEQREFVSLAISSEDLAKGVFHDLSEKQEIQEVANKYSLTINKFTAVRDGQLKKEIEDVIFKLNLGNFSQPVKIEDKYYIFKLDNIIPSRKQSLQEVQDGIYRFLFERKMQETLIKWLDGLKEHSYIKAAQ